MSNKGEPPGQRGAAPMQNLLLYVPPHHAATSSQSPSSIQQSQGNLGEHQHAQESNPAQIRSVPPRLVSSDTLQALTVVTDKKSKEECGDKTVQHIQYQTQLSNGIALPKDAIHLPNVISVGDNASIPPQYICKSIGDMNAQKNCIPNLMNNTFAIGIHNLQPGQRLVQQNEMFHCAPKLGDKTGNGNFGQANVCGNNYAEMNQESVGGNAMTLSRSESVRSETGESCSSLSSADSQSDCTGNILILPSQMHPALHGQQLLGQNQIVLNPNPTVLNQNHPSSNIVITGGSNAILPGQMDGSVGNTNQNYQLLDHNLAQQSIVNQSISIVNHQIISNRGGNAEGQQEGVQDRGSDGVPPDGIIRQGLPVGVEGEIVIMNNMPHQLVRTPNGIVLGVMPSAKQSAVSSGVSVGVGVVNGVQNVTNVVQHQHQQQQLQQHQQQLQSPQSQLQTQQDSSFIVVPQGWNRIVNGSGVVYLR